MSINKIEDERELFRKKVKIRFVMKDMIEEKIAAMFIILNIA